MLKILTVFGTRPEVIKMAPVIKELDKFPEQFVCRNCVTGQHRQMIDSLISFFDINVDHDLNIMVENQSLEHVTASVLKKLAAIFQEEKPDYVLVQGDTTTSMAASLAAFYHGIKVVHIEAGLRTHNRFHPYPEEVNRRIIDSISDLFFAHTQQARQNLMMEGVEENRIEVTGNTVIDALLQTARRDFNPKGTALDGIPIDGCKLILLTAHRRENFGQPLLNICQAVKQIASRYLHSVCFVYPVHLNPNVQKPVHSVLSDLDNVFVVKPLDYQPFVQLMKKSYFILTDSGGLQEEGPSLGKPVLVMRETTERPEAVAAGTAKVIGTRSDRIVENVSRLLEDKELYNRMSTAVNPYGDGKAAQRITKRLATE